MRRNVLRVRKRHATTKVAGMKTKLNYKYCMAFKRFTVFSRKVLLLLLLVFPARFGRSLNLDPGVCVSLCFSAQSRGRGLPDPALFLGLLTCEEFSDALCDLSECYMLSFTLLGLFKLLCGLTM